MVVPKTKLCQEQKAQTWPLHKVRSTHTAHMCPHYVGLRLCVNVAGYPPAVSGHRLVAGSWQVGESCLVGKSHTLQAGYLGRLNYQAGCRPGAGSALEKAPSATA